MIPVHRSPTADTRTCDYRTVSKAQLFGSSEQHIADVRAALAFFGTMLAEAAQRHDADKLTDIDSFYADFGSGFVQTEWWDRHRKMNRHHLAQPDGVPEDVNLIDVLEYICDCVCAGLARSGTVYPLEMPADLLKRAFQNTVSALQAQVVVAPDDA